MNRWHRAFNWLALHLPALLLGVVIVSLIWVFVLAVLGGWVESQDGEFPREPPGESVRQRANDGRAR